MTTDPAFRAHQQKLHGLGNGIRKLVRISLLLAAIAVIIGTGYVICAVTA